MNYINATTGKGWTGDEEKAFAAIQAVSRLNRLASIRLWKPSRRDGERAVRMAGEQYPPLSRAALDRLASMRAAKGAIAKTERPRAANKSRPEGLATSPARASEEQAPALAIGLAKDARPYTPAT